MDTNNKWPKGKRCKYVRKKGESCTLNNKCTYPNCQLVDIKLNNDGTKKSKKANYRSTRKRIA